MPTLRTCCKPAPAPAGRSSARAPSSRTRCRSTHAGAGSTSGPSPRWRRLQCRWGRSVVLDEAAFHVNQPLREPGQLRRRVAARNWNERFLDRAVRIEPITRHPDRCILIDRDAGICRDFERGAEHDCFRRRRREVAEVVLGCHRLDAGPRDRAWRERGSLAARSDRQFVWTRQSDGPQQMALSRARKWIPGSGTMISNISRTLLNSTSKEPAKPLFPSAPSVTVLFRNSFVNNKAKSNSLVGVQSNGPIVSWWLYRIAKNAAVSIEYLAATVSSLNSR